jgi:hypothetical protein
MSRFSHIYAPLTTVRFDHGSELEAQSFVKIYPNKATEVLMDSYKLSVKKIPEGFIVLYKRREEFVAQTVDEVIIIDDKEVIDKRIVGYASTTPDPTYESWLPATVDFNLEFYAIADQKFRENTQWNNLALNDFVVYSASDLTGTITPNTTIKERVQPDAIIQLNIVEANLTTPVSLTFQVAITP